MLTENPSQYIQQLMVQQRIIASTQGRSRMHEYGPIQHQSIEDQKKMIAGIVALERAGQGNWFSVMLKIQIIGPRSSKIDPGKPNFSPALKWNHQLPSAYLFGQSGHEEIIFLRTVEGWLELKNTIRRQPLMQQGEFLSIRIQVKEMQC